MDSFVKTRMCSHILAPRRGCFDNHLPLLRVRILAGAFLSYRKSFLYDKKTGMLSHSGSSRVREKIRTPDLLIRSQTLYPAELRAFFLVQDFVSLTTKIILPSFPRIVNTFFSKT